MLLAGCATAPARKDPPPPRDGASCLRVDRLPSKHRSLEVSRDGRTISEAEFRADALSYAPSAAVLHEVDDHRFRYTVGGLALGVTFLGSWAVGISGACRNGGACLLGVVAGMGASFLGMWGWGLFYGTDRAGEIRVAEAYNAGAPD